MLQGAQNGAGLRCSGRGGDLRSGAAKAAEGEEAAHGGRNMLWTSGECGYVWLDPEMATGVHRANGQGWYRQLDARIDI